MVPWGWTLCLHELLWPVQPTDSWATTCDPHLLYYYHTRSYFFVCHQTQRTAWRIHDERRSLAIHIFPTKKHSKSRENKRRKPIYARDEVHPRLKSSTIYFIHLICCCCSGLVSWWPLSVYLLHTASRLQPDTSWMSVRAVLPPFPPFF